MKPMNADNRMRTAFAVFTAMLMLTGAVYIMPEDDAESADFYFDSDLGKVLAPDEYYGTYSVSGNKLTLTEDFKASCISITGSNPVLYVKGDVTIRGSDVCIDCECKNLTISGTGSLTMRVFSCQGNVAISGGITFECTAFDITGSLSISKSGFHADIVHFSELKNTNMNMTGLNEKGTRVKLTEDNIISINTTTQTFILNGKTVTSVIIIPAESDGNWYFPEYLDSDGNPYEQKTPKEDNSKVFIGIAIVAIAALAVICYTAAARRRF